ncbi:uncharacterized protein [Apostichopus japonicus]|uniref:uncharacterized protein isoform X3 n=1 Tax=Stichopus japonicus TaxID=307972 RepID=UPI003AB191AC
MFYSSCHNCDQLNYEMSAGLTTDSEGSTTFASDPVTTRSGSDIRTVGSSSYIQTSFQTAKSDVPSSLGGITSSPSVTGTAERKGSTVANSDPVISTHYESFSHPTDITIISDTKVPPSPELGVPSDGRWSTLKDVDSTLMSTGSIRTELSSEKYHTEPFSDATEIVSPLTEDNYYSADLTRSPVTSSKTLTPFSGNGDDKTLPIVLSCVGFLVLAVVVCVTYYVYRYYKKKKTNLTVTPVNGHSPSPAAERRSGTFHNPDGNFVELYPATKPAWEGNDNDGYQSDSEVNGKNGGNGDSGVVVSPKPEMNGTEETKEDNKPKKKKMKKKKKAPDLNESLIERPPAEKKTKPTEVTT